MTRTERNAKWKLSVKEHGPTHFVVEVHDRDTGRHVHTTADHYAPRAAWQEAVRWCRQYGRDEE